VHDGALLGQARDDDVQEAPHGERRTKSKGGEGGVHPLSIGRYG